MAANKDNFCVIMGGGVGSRFWPFSRKTLPKQFLDFFGTGRSLLQQTYDRFKKVIPEENILIVTNDLYADLVKEQLPELASEQILLEPTRRNTAPCIAWASYHIRALNPDANIVVAPSDHLILKEEEFLTAIKKGLEFVAQSEKLLTLGIKPNRPETGYGYIQIDEPVGDNFYKVKTFTEKPELELAKIFVESGEFYWNSGLFMWNVNTIIKAGEQLLPEVTAKFEPGVGIYGTPEEKRYIDEHFPACPNVSIDFGIMEKARRALPRLPQRIHRLRHHGESRQRLRVAGRLWLVGPGHLEFALRPVRQRRERKRHPQMPVTALQLPQQYRHPARQQAGRHRRAGGLPGGRVGQCAPHLQER